jgi:glycosyltransferase involved in cell wall biosynthesis
MEPVFGLSFDGRCRSELLSTGVAVHDLGHARLSRPWTVSRARSRLGTVLRRVRPDAVVSHSAWSQAVWGATVRGAGIPSVLWAHDIATGHWLERWTRGARPDGVVATSQHTAASWRCVLPDAPVAVVYPPRAEPAAASSSSKAGVRKDLGVAETTVVVAQAGRMVPLKGHGVLLDALGRLRDARTWECWQMGGPQDAAGRSYLASLQDRARRLGIDARVRFLGERHDVPALLGAADVYCQPNTGAEAFGLTLVEALQAGLPVITTDCGGAREVVDATCGALVPVGDVDAVSTALERLIGDAVARRALGEAGPRRAAALCDPARQLARVEEILNTTRLDARGGGARVRLASTGP